MSAGAPSAPATPPGPASPRLLAISDLHVDHPGNLDALKALPPHPGDWLLVAGDVGDRPATLDQAFEVLTDRFEKVFWVPGNHELWVRDGGPRGEDRYSLLLERCRRHGVLSPEDPPTRWTGPGGPATIVPLFCLYDFSFRPDDVSREAVIDWAGEHGIRSTDDHWLHPDPWPSMDAWCAARHRIAEERLSSVEGPIVLLSHYPLRRDLVRLFRIPRFSPWCGTRRTEDWHRRYPIEVVVTGHLHMRATDWRDGVRFEEVALGYPRHWKKEKGVEGYLRQILPTPPGLDPSATSPIWHM